MITLLEKHIHENPEEYSHVRDNLVMIINNYKDNIARLSSLSESERPEGYCIKLFLINTFKL